MEPFTFFINYRRLDTGPIALLLKYEIEQRLQFVRVFVDVEDIEPGAAFPDRIADALDHSHAVISLIGKHWMPYREPLLDGGHAPKPDADWVVTELSLADERPLKFKREYRYGLGKRVVIPLFIDTPAVFDVFDVPAPIRYLTQLNASRIDYASWPTTIGPLIERLAVNLNLKKRPDSDEYPPKHVAKARTQPIDDAALTSILQYEDYDGWYIDNYGSTDVRYLVKNFRFPHFNHAADFMRTVSDHCRVLDHHPEWRNVFNYVTVSLTTWDARRRVTIYDLNLALFMNKAAAEVLRRG